MRAYFFRLFYGMRVPGMEINYTPKQQITAKSVNESKVDKGATNFLKIFIIPRRIL